MDRFVKGENYIWKMPAKKRISLYKNSLSISGEESAGLPPPPHSLEDVQNKKKHP